MRTTITLLVVLAGVLCAPSMLSAQEEVQVALDEDGQVDEVDRELARRLGLFLDEYPQLRVVRLYDVEQDGFVLEITLRRDERTARQRVHLTAAEVRELRSRVSRALARNAPEVTLNQDGRFLLLGTATALGVSFYGGAVPVIFDIDSGRLALAAYMFTAGTSFVGPYLYTKTRPVTYGMANAGFWGATRGISHGFLLANALRPDVEEVPDGALRDPARDDGNIDERVDFALGMGVSIAEGLGGYVWAHRTGMTPGAAHTIGNFGDFGTAWAGELLMITRSENSQVNAATTLAGAVSGIFAGAKLAPSLPYTWGDAEIQRTAHALGGVHGAVVFDWFFGQNPTENDIRYLGALLLAGSAAGTWGVDRVLDGHDFSVGEGILTELGTVAGGLLGLGVGVLLSPEELDDPTLLFTLGAAGADFGFWATYRSLSESARERARRTEDGSGGAREAPSRLELFVDPTALVMLTPAAPELGEVGLPFVSFRYRF